MLYTFIKIRYIKLALPHALHVCDETFFLGLVSKFSRKIKKKEVTKNHIQQSKSYEQ